MVRRGHAYLLSDPHRSGGRHGGARRVGLTNSEALTAGADLTGDVLAPVLEQWAMGPTLATLATAAIDAVHLTMLDLQRIAATCCPHRAALLPRPV
ncbi:MAG: hypothetical protein WD638_10170 [Nitriliruptoraceae bacterium]